VKIFARFRQLKAIIERINFEAYESNREGERERKKVQSRAGKLFFSLFMPFAFSLYSYFYFFFLFHHNFLSADYETDIIHNNGFLHMKGKC
jgi:hypothetical protein